MAHKVRVVVGSTRPGRVGLPIGEWVTTMANSHPEIAAELVDLRQVDLPMFDEPKHPNLGLYQHDHTLRWSETVSDADAFVFVVPEYNHGMNAAMKNALDFLFNEWNHKPVVLVTYGGVSAGLRAAEQVRQVCGALKMYVLTEGLPIPMVSAFMKDGKFVADEALTRKLTAALAELARTTTAMGALRTAPRS